MYVLFIFIVLENYILKAIKKCTDTRTLHEHIIFLEDELNHIPTIQIQNIDDVFQTGFDLAGIFNFIKL